MPRIQPRLGVLDSEYEMTDGIAKAEYWFEEVKEAQELHDGSGKFYHKGYKFHGRLIFTAAPYSQYEGLRLEYNRHIELNFIPNPQDYPDTNFEVRWINEFNFIYAYTPRTDRYSGIIELEGTEILSSVPAWM